MRGGAAAAGRNRKCRVDKAGRLSIGLAAGGQALQTSAKRAFEFSSPKGAAQW